ncbi:sialin-like isoform X1 [Acyrthosiphon pisum]|uniref:Major facilitator superfamily (MFS) profile domain-containing protein n=1 Tax=Acyrthosiphon pisum TaxID=7029 RepID=A0A8R1WBV6_ACYPI|nr:sialin-like isoform X1 [Acyrthosiphon pisum]|eukprot:XP_003246944.1 PREDICTED: sialin-like isoform X1 [Acyrthosiphon pisum]
MCIIFLDVLTLETLFSMMTLQQPHSNSNNSDNENEINNISVVGSYTLRQRRRRCATNGWLTMVFLAYSFLLTVRVHFMYSMMVMMNVPLVARTADLQPCPGAVLNVGRNSTIVVARRLDWTIREQAATMGAYFFGTLVSTLPGGMYSNHGYERSIMMWCVAITAATLALVPIAFVQYESWVAVTFLRFLQGCAFGPTGSCGGTLAGKIIPKKNRILYTTFMFSGTMFGGSMGNLYSGIVIPNVSHDGSYFVLSVIGFVWVAVWATMMHLTPYDSDLNSIPMSVSFISSSWTMIIQSMPFISLLNASFGLGFLYSFVTTCLPIYTANVLGGDAMRNGIPVSVTWLVGWITSIIAGISAESLTNVDTITKTTVRKMYVGIVLIGSPIMLFGAMVAGCDSAYVKTFTRTSVILLGFERSSIRINSIDLCPGYMGSLIAMCDVFYSMGNIIDLVVVRSLFADTMNWSVTFHVIIIVSISCSILFLFFGSSLQQCWDQRYIRP